MGQVPGGPSRSTTRNERLYEQAVTTLQARGLGPGPHPARQGSLRDDAVAWPAGDVELASDELEAGTNDGTRDLDAARRRHGALPW